MEKQPVKIPSQSDTIAGTLFSANNKKQQKLPSPCVIICHGAFEYKENFFELADFLCKNDISAIAIDMPGHGESTGSRFHIDIDLWVRSIRATVNWLTRHPDIEKNRIGAFGFSSGGTAVFEAALKEPQLKLLITLDATVRNYLGPWDTFSFKALNTIGTFKKKITGKDLRLKLAHVLKNAQVAHDPEINQSIISDPKMIEAYSAFPLPGAAPCAFVDTIERIHKITIPTLVLHGKQDHIDPPETAEKIFEALTCEKSLELLPRSGHCGHLDTDRYQVMELTRKWIKNHL